MKYIPLFSIITSLNFAFSQGLIFDSTSYVNLPKWEQEDLGYASALPTRISYANYTPYVGNQGPVGTCVGWAVAYGQLTTQQNLRMGITNVDLRSWRAMDPHFVYAFIRDLNDQWCQQGTQITDAMEVLTNFGCKPKYWEPILSCNSTLVTDDFVMAQAAPYRISEWGALSMDAEPVKGVKQALAAEYIVTVGMNLTESFQSGQTVYSGKWSPKYGEKYIGGHAMCVVGYDDYKYGGAFQILNSYGSQFGDNGFIWITYSDFAKTMNQAFIIETPGYRSNSCLYGDCREGYSIYRTQDKGFYEGYTENGYPAIFGQYIYSDGSMYVGGWKNGRKDGYGLYYDTESSSYYSVAFSNDVLVDSEALQGYAGDGLANNVQKIYDIMIEGKQGELFDENSSEFKKFSKSYDVPVEPVKLD
jgi:hypothetical protein